MPIPVLSRRRFLTMAGFGGLTFILTAAKLAPKPRPRRKRAFGAAFFAPAFA